MSTVNLTNKEFKIFLWPKSTGGSLGPPVEPMGVPTALRTPFKSVHAWDHLVRNRFLYCSLPCTPGEKQTECPLWRGNCSLNNALVKAKPFMEENNIKDRSTVTANIVFRSHHLNVSISFAYKWKMKKNISFAYFIADNNNDFK